MINELQSAHRTKQGMAKRFQRAAALLIAALAALAAGPRVSASTATMPTAKKKVAEITLSGTLQQCPQGFSFSLLSLGANHSPALTSTISLIKKAIVDPQVSGLFFNLHGFALSLTQAQELGQLITLARHDHKQVLFYSTNYSENTYLLAAHANKVIMSRQGNLYLPGVELQLMFFRGLLQKLHLQADMVQIGKFKGAEEPFTRFNASKAFAAQVEGLINGWYAQIVASIVAHRPGMTTAAAENAINQGWLTARSALKQHLIDGLASRQNIDSMVQTKFLGGCQLIGHFGSHATKPLVLDSPFAIFRLLGSHHRKPPSKRPAVAVICAGGVIMDDSPANDANGAIITPHSIHQSLKAAERNPRVKAIVLRVDSPGGSAQASESIWQMLHHCKKPLYVSMGAEAASGGYYISTAGKKIFADPGTIAGSIGVVGGKVVIGGLFSEIGLGVETFSKGDHVTLFDSTVPFTPSERKYVAALMRSTYRLFTHRVMESRGSHIAHIALVARGRLFTGKAAIKAGLVDADGSLSDTVAAVASAAKIHGPYGVIVLPAPKSLATIIREKLGIQASLPLGMSTMLMGIPKNYRQSTIEMYQMLHVLQNDQVLLAAPLGYVQN